MSTPPADPAVERTPNDGSGAGSEDERTPHDGSGAASGGQRTPEDRSSAAPGETPPTASVSGAPHRFRVAVLASGSGTILDAMLDEGVAVELVVVDRPSGATGVAERHGVPWTMVERTSFGADFDRDAYSARLASTLTAAGVDLVVMAGFATILTEPVFEAFDGRVLNTHPALLPAFKGWHAVPAALEAGVKVTGCTVHVATPEVDDGPILAQEAVAVVVDDTVESLHERIKVVERRLYVDTLKQILERGSVL